jgi:hypothetical protein
MMSLVGLMASNGGSGWGLIANPTSYFNVVYSVHCYEVCHYTKPTKCTLTVHLISHFTPTCFGVHDAIIREYTKFKSATIEGRVHRQLLLNLVYSLRMAS